MLIRKQGLSNAGGFSLVELMIALVVGLIVLGAVLTFTVTMLRSYSENIRSTRLTQELRTSMNVISRELRRAGFDASSVSRVLTASNPSNFINLVATDDCVSYQYDRGEGTLDGGPETTEFRAVRLNAGKVQMSAGDGTSCSGVGTWADITDPSVVEITAFAPNLIETPFCSKVGETKDPTTGLITSYQLAQGSVRHLRLCLKGRLVADNSIARQVTNTTRVRAENVSFVNSATDCLASAPATLLTPSGLNLECEETP